MSELNNKREKRDNSGKAVMIAFLTLAWPTVLEQFLGTILQYVDTAMVGRLGAEATATVSLSTTYTWLINAIMGAAGVAFLSYVARAIGENETKKVRHAAGQVMLVAGFIGILLTAIVLMCAPYMPVWMGAEDAIRKDSSIYFALINAPLFLRSELVIYGTVLRSTGDTKTPMKVNLLVNFSNMILNYIFIYVLAYGAIGAGIATAISFSMGGLLMIRAFIRNPVLKVGESLREEGLKFLLPRKMILKPVLSMAIPMLLTRIAACTGYIVFTSFVSSMSTVVFAAHSIAITAEEMFYIPAYGMQQATSTLIGNALGEGDKDKERAVVHAALLVIVLLMVLSGAGLFVSASFMMGLFTSDQQVITTGALLLRIVAVTEPIYGAAVVMEGAFAGLGRAKFPLFVELLCRWGVRIAGSYVLLHRFSGTIVEVWYAMIADNIIRAILLGSVLFFGILKRKERRTTL